MTKTLAVERIEGHGFRVTSGINNYIVTIKTQVDRTGSMYFQRRCSCSAAQYGRACKHLAAVETFEWEEASAAQDYDAMDMLERTM